MTYLRILRERNGLSQSDIARLAGVEPKQVYRWEKCQSEPTGSSLAIFVHAVRGNPEYVNRLIIENSLEEAQQLAQAELVTEKNKKLLDSDNVVLGMELVLELRRHPAQLSRWVEIGRELVREG